MQPFIERPLRLAAWACLAVIVFSTLSPIEARPHLASQGLEHVLAFAVLAGLFCLAYPRRMPLVAALIVAAAVLLELSQLLLPDRHARLLDLARKGAGGLAGAAAAFLVHRLLRRR